MRPLPLVLSLLVAGAVGAAEPPPAVHLLRGAEHFRDARFAEALVEFRVAERRGAGGEALWYAAATLLKLERFEEAVDTFARAEASDPDGGDVLLAYYRAVACSEIQLFQCAARHLDRVVQSGGPRVAAEARRLRAQVQAKRGGPSTPAQIDDYLRRGLIALDEGWPWLAGALIEEASHHSAKMSGAYRVDDLRAAMERVERARAEAGEAGSRR